jgi:hypothetical protein
MICDASERDPEGFLNVEMSRFAPAMRGTRLFRVCLLLTYALF